MTMTNQIESTQVNEPAGENCKLDPLDLNPRQQNNFRKHFNSGEPADCWPWIGAVGTGGYGVFAVNRRIRMAHRVSYRMSVGYFDPSLKVCHRCDNPICVNPGHLFVGTQADNIADMDSKGRRRMACGSSNGSVTKPHSRPRGERNTEAKLSSHDVNEIIACYIPRVVTLSALASRFGVKKCTIWKIVKRRTWTHINPPSC